MRSWSDGRDNKITYHGITVDTGNNRNCSLVTDSSMKFLMRKFRWKFHWKFQAIQARHKHNRVGNLSVRLPFFDKRVNRETCESYDVEFFASRRCYRVKLCLCHVFWTQTTKAALERVDSWPQFAADAYDQNPELRSAERFSAFLRRETERHLSNHTTANSADDWLDAVQIYWTAVRQLAGRTTAELQTRGKPGFWAKTYAVDCLLWSLASLIPVRAVGAAVFFGGTKLRPAEKTIYLSYRRRTEDGLACGELSRPMNHLAAGPRRFWFHMVGVAVGGWSWPWMTSSR